MQLRHFNTNGFKWFGEHKQTQAMRMYDKIFNMKFLPPGRGLWAMGTPITEDKHLYGALNNCAFVSTDCHSVDQFVRTFEFLMDSSMLGIGVGFDTKGKSKFKVYKPTENLKIIKIGDSREAWVKSTADLLSSYLKQG